MAGIVNFCTYTHLERERGKQMAFSYKNQEFDSWDRALRENKLKPEQLAVLQDMVHDCQVESLERAARLLDWQDAVLNPDEHLYGL